MIKSVLTIPALYDALHDDNAVPADQWEPVVHPLAAYVAIREGDELLGIAIMALHSRIMVEVHNALLPHVGWKRRVRIGKEFFEWLWRAGRLRAIGKVPEYNRYAMKFNRAIGMSEFGVNEKCFIKGGRLQAEVWFGISAPDLVPAK